MCAWSQRCWERSRHDASRRRRSRPRAIAAHQGLVLASPHASSRCSGSSAMPAPASPRITAPCHRRARARRREPRRRVAAACSIAAFTGKAALVMTRKGTPASTIHSLIYRVSEATPEEIARVEQELPTCAPASAAWAPARALVRRDADPPPRAAPRATCTSRASCSTSSRCCATPTSSCSTRSRWSATRWPPTCWPSASRSWCSAIPGSCRRSRAKAPSPTAQPDVMLTEIHRQAGESADRPPRHHGAAGRADPVTARMTTFVWKMRRGDVAAGAAAERRPGDLRAQRTPGASSTPP